MEGGGREKSSKGIWVSGQSPSTFLHLTIGSCLGCCGGRQGSGGGGGGRVAGEHSAARLPYTSHLSPVVAMATGTRLHGNTWAETGAVVQQNHLSGKREEKKKTRREKRLAVSTRKCFIAPGNSYPLPPPSPHGHREVNPVLISVLCY